MEKREVTEPGIRGVQRRHLLGETIEDDKWMIDAVLSCFPKFISANVESSYP
jgi:hypothetical protein